MCSAALLFARRGWPVFPCRERDSTTTNHAGNTRAFKAKAPYTGQGLKDATTDERRILAWWRDHPNALIGLPTGGTNGCFVLDFDPREDADSGEIWTLESLKADLEAQMGVPLPRSVTAITQSDGVHVYFRQPAGEPIRNRGNLPAHVDVRGLGGYVIAPPSIMVDTGARYRWLDRGDWRDDAAIADAPAELIEILRSRAPKAKSDRAVPPVPRGTAKAVDVDDDIRKYGLSALDGECREIRSAASGKRNDQLNISALKIASLVAAGAIEETLARSMIEAAARDNPGADDDAQLLATISSGWTAGIANPRDLAEIAAASRSRRERGPPRASSRLSSPAPDRESDGKPSSQAGGQRFDIGGNGVAGAEGAALTRECAFLPHTDLGNLERFLKRHGRDFLYVEQWGWLAWDSRRWNRDMAVALLGRAVQDTMRSIQQEAAFIEDSGIPVPALELFDAEQLRAHELQQKGKFDRIVKKDRNGSVVSLFSDTIAKWGRTSEGAGHITCIAKMAEARLSARPDDFDTDPLLLNVENGTLQFRRPGADHKAGARLIDADRAHRITKIAAARYDIDARCPRYDAFLEEVQPSADMRDWVDVWSGYNSLGLADAQKMALYYGQGSNGKSVDVDVKAYILGDYARVCGIETFIDQGKYRKGSDATPDLAALAGRRMVRASEPEDGSKFSDGLIKAMTGSEPVPVRELLKPPFEMPVTFKVTVSANNKPKIGTDHGIQRRMQLIPWGVIIPDDRQDTQLTGKLKAEASGILNRMVRGAIRYLTNGLPEPEAVREATREYQQENDLLGQFLALCIVKAPGETLGASKLHALFAGWQTWANQLAATGKPWSPKYLNGQMQKKGYSIRKSSSMMWDDIATLFDVTDFVDQDGKAVTTALPDPRRTPKLAVDDAYLDDDMPP